MAASIKIDQAGLSAGGAGQSRTDGLDGGETVTLTNEGGGSTTRFILRWAPVEDIAALASLAPTAPGSNVWSFTPSQGAYGEYLIECIEDEGQITQSTQRRVFGVRLPASGLLVPALNTVADPTASLQSSGPAQVAASDNNATDFTSEPLLNNYAFAGWWRAMRELFFAVEAGGGGGGAVTSVKGADGITPTTAQVGIVTLSGSELLPLDGSRAMTGDLDMDSNAISNSGPINGVTLTSSGSASDFLNAAGGYVPVPGGGVTNLQQAYDGGPSVNTNATTGSLSITGTEALNFQSDQSIQAVATASFELVCSNGPIINVSDTLIYSPANVALSIQYSGVNAWQYAGNGAGSFIGYTSVGNYSIAGVGAASFWNVSAFQEYNFDPAGPTGSFNAGTSANPYQDHSFRGNGTSGQFAAQGHEFVRFTGIGSASGTFQANNFNTFDITARAGGGTLFTALNYDSVNFASSASGVGIFTVNDFETVNIATSGPTGSMTIESESLRLFSQGILQVASDGTQGSAGEFLGSDGAGGTKWLTPAGGGTSSLQQAYNAGPAIVTNSGVGALDISGTEEIRIRSTGNQLYEADNFLIQPTAASGNLEFDGFNSTSFEGAGARAFSIRNMDSVSIFSSAAGTGNFSVEDYSTATFQNLNQLTLNSGNTQITGSGLLRVITPNGGGTSGQFLGSDGFGGVEWQTPSGGGGGTISQINVIGLGITNPNGPIATIDATALQTATAQAQNTADQAILDAGNAQTDATQALADAAGAQSTADSKLSGITAGTPNVTIDSATDPLNPSISVAQTTAGLLANVYFTADSVTTTEGTFYETNIVDKGSTASSGITNQLTLTTPSVFQSFPRDFLGPTATAPVLIPSGAYTGFITAQVSSNNGDQDFIIESYVCDVQGAPIDAGGVVGSLGFETLNIAESGRVDLTANRETSVRMDTTQAFSYTLAVGQRVRYLVRVQKVGGSGTSKVVTLFSGSDFNSFFQIPILAPAIAYDAIEDEGTELSRRTTINFVGAGVTATDDAVNGKTIVTIPGGGGGGGVTSIAAGPGIAVDSSNPAIPIVSSSIKGALQTWPIASARSNQPMTGNFPVGRAYAVAAIAAEDTTINTIEFFCAQNAGGGTYGVAIYNTAGVRLAYESGQTGALGINVAQLTNDTGTPVAVALAAGSAYYLVVESDINSFNLVARPTYNPPISATVPPISFFVPNSRSVDPTGLPANISAFFGQVGSGVQNYWMQAFTT